MPEADAVLGFDDYADIAGRLRSILAGERPAPTRPATAAAAADRARRNGRPRPRVRSRARAADAARRPGTGEPPAPSGAGSTAARSAPLKIASGCDRRCTFCAIPAFRGAYVSRPPAEIVAEARWLVEQGVREVFLVSENTSSYGKDLGDLRRWRSCCAELAGVDGIELGPGVVPAAGRDAPEPGARRCRAPPKVVPYFDLSFQHASGAVLRRMRRFGDADSFLALIGRSARGAPTAGIRSNVICGFPGETEADLDGAAASSWSPRELDAIGVFGYSDEDGTEAAPAGRPAARRGDRGAPLRGRPIWPRS